MQTISSAAEMTAVSKEARRSGKRVGLVPTMGALHEGHLSLVRAARSQCDVVAVSIFVNPTQFGPEEDFSKYPRAFEQDAALLQAERVDFVFNPSVEEMYPNDWSTWVTVAGLSERLDGRSRPGHFRGVTTIVSKLFHIVQPELAFFGQKDAAQAAIIRKMVHDLDLDVRILVCPIVREKDGLALSSRNIYLTPEQRKQATVLYRSLMRVQTLADQGQGDAAKLVAAGKQVLAEEQGVRVDYFEIVNWETLDSVQDISNGALVAVAAYVGKTRLIDNVVLHGVGQVRNIL
jgi:pantoate--beta-alanine ligase